MTSIRLPAHRPAYRRWTIALLAVLFVVGLNALWDYREARRVSTTIGRLRSAGARTSTRVALSPLPAQGGSRDASSLWLAAAVLAGASGETARLVGRDIDLAAASGPIGPALLERLATVIEAQADALTLVDRAKTLPFAGFPAGTVYVNRSGDMADLYYLCGLRTLHAALTDQSANASLALLTELGLIRSNGVLGDDVLPSRFITAEHVALVLSRTSPSDSDLVGFASRLREADDDGVLARQLDGRRARSIEMFLSRARYGAAFSWEWLIRPVAARTFLSNLDAFGEKVATAGRPWPDRLDVGIGMTSGPSRWFSSWMGEPAGLPEETIRIFGRDLAALRAAQLAVAIERYRRAHEGNYPTAVEQLSPDFIEALPIDPYSGRPMRFQSTASELVAYSIGLDRTDNAGNLTGPAASGFSGTSRQLQPPAGDIGIRIAKRTGQ